MGRILSASKGESRPYSGSVGGGQATGVPVEGLVGVAYQSGHRNEWQVPRGIRLAQHGQMQQCSRTGSLECLGLASQRQALALEGTKLTSVLCAPQVRWMMYWIVFAIFMAAETFTDVFVSWSEHGGWQAVGWELPILSQAPELTWLPVYQQVPFLL